MQSLTVCRDDDTSLVTTLTHKPSVDGPGVLSVGWGQEKVYRDDFQDGNYFGAIFGGGCTTSKLITREFHPVRLRAADQAIYKLCSNYYLVPVASSCPTNSVPITANCSN